MNTRLPSRQSGVAVVLAMGVVALAAIAATAILVSQNSWARQGELAAQRAQAALVVKAGIDWGRAVLSDDRRSSNVDHLSEAWALRLPPMPVENGKMSGHLEDQNGRFNLNNLVRNGQINTAQLDHFKRERAYARNPADFRLWLPKDARFAENDVTVSSDYFIARVQVIIGSAEASGAALLLRQGSDWPTIVWQKSI